MCRHLRDSHPWKNEKTREGRVFCHTPCVERGVCRQLTNPLWLKTLRLVKREISDSVLYLIFPDFLDGWSSYIRGSMNGWLLSKMVSNFGPSDSVGNTNTSVGRIDFVYVSSSFLLSSTSQSVYVKTVLGDWRCLNIGRDSVTPLYPWVYMKIPSDHFTLYLVFVRTINCSALTNLFNTI